MCAPHCQCNQQPEGRFCPSLIPNCLACGTSLSEGADERGADMGDLYSNDLATPR